MCAAQFAFGRLLVERISILTHHCAGIARSSLMISLELGAPTEKTRRRAGLVLLAFDSRRGMSYGSFTRGGQNARVSVSGARVPWRPVLGGLTTVSTDPGSCFGARARRGCMRVVEGYVGLSCVVCVSLSCVRYVRVLLLDRLWVRYWKRLSLRSVRLRRIFVCFLSIRLLASPSLHLSPLLVYVQ
ncbi:hypothetical protein C8Q74DRAFT_1295233 [Fomes fomentarius]|nr:hypothetical protein C8Q74DRAFT_1295233 [Fomes fomentarius]